MAYGERCTLSLCVYSAELDSAANGAYCKVYVDANDHTNGSSSSHATSDASSPDPTRGSDGGGAARSFHTHVEKSEKKTYLPTWNENFTIDVFDRRHEILTIRLKSKKLLHVSVVGACAIPLHQIPTNRPVDQWFPVQKGGKRRGKLRLQMMITFPQQQAPLSSVGTPPQQRLSAHSPPQQQHSFNHQRTGSQDYRRSMEQRSSGGSASLHQRPSSLTSPPSAQNQLSGYHAQAVPQAVAQHASLATYGYEPEDEPQKDKSPLKQESFEIYRPATNPRLDLESDDDDEASFPRVAELHRLESDLIGESSDEEAETHLLAPKSPLYLERLTEGGGSAGEEGRPSSVRGSNATPTDQNEELTIDDFKPRPSVESKPAGDRRTSVEVARQTKVTVPKEDLDRMLELSAVTASSYDDVEEGIDMSGVTGDFNADRYDSKSPSQGSHSSDVAIGEVVAAEVVAGEVVDDVWNRRYSSSSSEELQLPYPDEDVHNSRSSAASVHEGIAVSFHEGNPFVEPGSPSHSSQDEESEEVQHRESISSDGGSLNEFFGTHDARSSSPSRKKSSPRNSWVSEKEATAMASGAQQDSSPRHSWVSASTETPAVMTGRDKSWSGTSWVSEQSEANATAAKSPKQSSRDKSWSGTSWVSEHDSATVVTASSKNESSSPRHSWVSEKSEVEASNAPSLSHPVRLTGRDKSWSGTSWINENDNTSFVDATGPRSSWISEDGESNVGGETSPRHSWVSESVSEAPARLTGRDKSWSGTSWINENDSNSFVDATGQRSSWVSEDGASNTGDATSPRHSWVSDAASETPARVTGRDKSWSGTSWISDHDDNGVPDALEHEGNAAQRSSWVSESDDDGNRDTFDAATGSQTSWVREDGAPPQARLTGRDKSWSGTSWISDHDNTSFVDATGLRSSWINDDHDNHVPQSSSPRHSWDSEDGGESPARLTGRDKSWSGTSWVREHDNSFVSTSGPQPPASPRSSWVSEDSDAVGENADASRHSWVSDRVSESPAPLKGRDKTWSGTSWISEHDNTSFVASQAPSKPEPPRSSWISEDANENLHASTSPRHSWVSENNSEQPRLTGRDKSWSGTSWVSERDNTSFVDASGPAATGSPRSSWVSEADSAIHESHHTTSHRTSWVSEHDGSRAPGSPRSSWISEDGTESVSAGARSKRESPRHSWVSERELGNDSTSPPRTSWVSEESYSASHRRRVSSSQTSWVNEATESNSFMHASSRHSFVSESSAEENVDQVVDDAEVAILPAPARDSVEVSSPPRVSLLSEISDIIEAEQNASPRSSISAEPSSEPASQADTFVSERVSATSSIEVNERQPHGSLSAEAAVASGSRRDSYSSDAADKHAGYDNATTPRGSVSSERLSMESDMSSAPRVSFVSDTHIDVDNEASPLASTSVPNTNGDHRGSLDERRSVDRSEVRSSEGGRSSGYDGDNIETSTTRSSSLFSDQARETATTRSSSSSSSGVDTYVTSSYPGTYTDLTRPNSISSAGIENSVYRDDAERHAEAVAEAARYSSSSDDQFDHEVLAIRVSSLTNDAVASRRYSSASEGDTVDRSSIAVGYEYDDLSTGRSQSSSVAARDEAQFAAWTEESSTNGDFSDAMRRGSQVSSLSDMYDASPRVSEDLGVIPESHPRVSIGSSDSSASLKIEAPASASSNDMRRFISSVNVLVEPYDDESPRSSISNAVSTSASHLEGVEAAKTINREAIDSVSAPATSVATVGDIKVTVTVGTPHEDVKPAPVNPFVEYGSSRGSLSSEDEVVDIDERQVEAMVASTRSSHSSEGDHEVIVVETLDQLGGPVDRVTVTDNEHVETKASRVSSVASERLSVASSHVHLDNLIATREYVDAGIASPISSLSSTSPRDPAFDGIVVARELLDRAAAQCETKDIRVSTTSEITVSSSTQSMPIVRATDSPVAPVATPPTASPASVTTAHKVSFSTETVDRSPKQNVRGDHVLVSMASSLTRAQLQAVARDYLPSDDSDNDSDALDSDADLNFDSDTD